MARNDEAERYEAALRRRRLAEFVARWGLCERGHVLTDLNRDARGRCWCCTRGHERAFEASRSGWESIPLDPHTNEETLARSLASTASDEADPDVRNVIELLDGIPGALERAQLGAEQARTGLGTGLDEL